MLINKFTSFIKNACKKTFNTTRIPCMLVITSDDVDCSNESHFLQLLYTENANNVLFAFTDFFIK